MKVLAPAKVNLYFNVLGRRADGYHAIETVFQTVSLYDRLEFRCRNGSRSRPSLKRGYEISLSVRSERNGECPGDRSNLVWRAADRLLSAMRWSGTCDISLVKDIPVQAGLGGGSSDAAHTISHLAATLARPGNAAPLPDQSLRRIARGLGADVPFFLSGGCAMAGGVGERLVPVRPSPEFWSVVVKPALGLSTAEVYRWYDEDRGRGRTGKASGRGRRGELTKGPQINKIVRLIRQKRPLSEWSRYCYNCFEEVVFPRVPLLRKIKETLIDRGALSVTLSGSGSALFGIVSSRAQGEKIRRELKGLVAQSWVVRSTA